MTYLRTKTNIGARFSDQRPVNRLEISQSLASLARQAATSQPRLSQTSGMAQRPPNSTLTLFDANFYIAHDFIIF